MISRVFFKRNAVQVAKELLGKKMQFNKCSGYIVETEAYRGPEDEASHGAKKTKRSALMWETFGFVYVYFVYGNHYCLNFTCEEGNAAAVLIRAIQPLNGVALMQKRRKVTSLEELTNGPGKLCQAFGITTEENGTPINEKIKLFEGLKNFEVATAKRIGIKKATDLEWRFYIKGNEFVSKT